MDDKKRNPLTREKILSAIGRTEENIQSGASFKDMLPFFVQYKLQLRVYDYLLK